MVRVMTDGGNYDTEMIIWKAKKICNSKTDEENASYLTLFSLLMQKKTKNI